MYLSVLSMFVKCRPLCTKIKELSILTTDCLSFEIYFVVRSVYFKSMKRTAHGNHPSCNSVIIMAKTRGPIFLHTVCFQMYSLWSAYHTAVTKFKTVLICCLMVYISRGFLLYFSFCSHRGESDSMGTCWGTLFPCHFLVLSAHSAAQIHSLRPTTALFTT